MEIKGTGIKTTRDFVKSTFPDQYNAWLETLPEKSRAMYVPAMLNLAGWYPMKDGYLIPMEKMVDFLYGGDEKSGGEALGRFSAEMALTGIYKLFLIVASPKYLMQRASIIFTTYYLPCDIKVVETGNKSVSMQVSKFPDMTRILEFRIGGWNVRALELCGCKSVRYDVKKSIVKGDSMTEHHYRWE